MSIADITDKWLDAGAAEYRAPVTYHTQIAFELSLLLQTYAAAQNVKPETIIAEALRAYLGADA